MLEIRNVKKKYNKELVLNNINIKFAKTGLVCILGESGSGKSTLLNLIGGLDKPTEGNIYYNFLDINRLSNKELNNYHRHEIGFIFQQYNLIKYSSVEDNILLGRPNQDITNILDKLNITNLRKQKVNTLSGGEQERVAIARSLLNKPKVLLGDEPTGALDSYNSKIIMEYLKEYSKDHLVIIVTHDETLARSYSDRIIRLKDGHIISDSNEYKINEEFNTYDIPNTVISNESIINIAINNFKNKKKRYIFSILSSVIGLISLLLILSITNGFNKSMDNYEKNYLSNYPLIISETSTSLENQISNITKKESYSNDKIYLLETKTNNITYNLLNKINNLSKYTNFIQYNYTTDTATYNTFTNDYYKKELNLLTGTYPKYDNEVLLVVGESNEISKEEYYYLNITNGSNIDTLINTNYNLDNNTFTIKGIAKFKESSALVGTSLIIYKNNIFKDILPRIISIYPKDYNSKKLLKKELTNISYTDYATSIKNISKDIIHIISLVLIVFSSITLSVSILMISLITYISIFERIHEIGLLSSLGISNKYIKRIFYYENILTSFISSIISIIFICMIKYPSNKLIMHYIGLNNLIKPNISIIITIFIINIIISLIGTIFPIKKINKLNIVDTLKYE